MPSPKSVDAAESPAASPGRQEQPAGRMRRDLAIALSLSNLCYLRVWSELLTYRYSDTYLMKSAPGTPELAAVMTDVLLMAAVLWGLITLARRTFSAPAFRWVQAAFLLYLLLPLNALREVGAHYVPYFKSALFDLLGVAGVAALAAILVLTLALVVLRFRSGASRFASNALVTLLPFCVLTYGQAIWKLANQHPADFAPNPPAAILPDAKTSPRVVWLLFDEWDYRLTFTDRKPGLQLPEVDRLAMESVVASHAWPPGDETPKSIPGYFIGKLVDNVEYDGPRELQLQLRNGPKRAPWSAQPTVFSAARKLGFNTALVDWFHPTCRILNDLTSCEWWEMPRQFNSMGHTYGQQVVGQTRSLFESTLFSVFGQSLSVRYQVEGYHEILEHALAVANNRTYGLSFIHLPIPHAPHAYDRRTGQFTLRNSPIRGYFDSLALLDRTLGEIRTSMEASGTWDQSTVIVTSDHPYREADALDGKSDPHIPYLIKMPLQKVRVPFDHNFCTVTTQDLVLAILRGEVTRPEQVTAWLTANQDRVP